MNHVSVIIPTHNAADYIVQSVESALSQSGCKVEVIVVDDGSTDDTLKRLDPYLERIRLLEFRNPHNTSTSRIAASRNYGLQAATGEFIAFLDSDDLWLPESLGKRLSVFLIDPEVGLVYGKLSLIDTKGAPFNSPYLPIDIGQPIDNKDKSFKQLLLGNKLPTSSVVIRSQCIRDVGCFDESLIYSEDWDFWVRISDRWQIAFINQVVGHYRIHPNNDQLSKLYSRGKSRGLRQVVERAIAREGLLDKDPKFSRRALAKVYWNGALIEYGVGDPDADSQLSQALYYDPYLLFDNENLRTIAHLATEVCALSQDPMKSSEDLVEKIVHGLPVTHTQRSRIRAIARGELYAGLTFRHLQLGQRGAARRMAIRAIRSDPSLISNRGLLSVISGRVKYQTVQHSL